MSQSLEGFRGYVPKVNCPTCGTRMRISRFIDGSWTGQWCCDVSDCPVSHLTLNGKLGSTQYKQKESKNE